MIRTPYSVFIPLFITLFSYFQSCENIAFDYPVHPYHPFDIEHAELTLDLESDQHLVNGTVTYLIRSKIDSLTKIQLHDSELSIDEILVNKSEVDYEVQNDSLIIQLTDTINAEEKFEISISWQSISNFGLHRSSDGAFWSSLNPLAHRHWLPGFDHPREAFSFVANIEIPNEMEVLFNGDLKGVQAKSDARKIVTWNSDSEMPMTGLGFVMGDFLISEMTAGFTKIRLFHHSKDRQKAADLIVEAARLKKEIEDVLSFEYPWESLNIVILPDNYWMERTHGTGTVYLFERLGNLENQLARNMYAQWFGEYQRKEQYLNLENEGENGLLPTALHFQVMDSAAFIQNPDSLLRIEYWNKWQASYRLKSKSFKSTIEESLEGFMRSFSGIVHFNDYAEIWYQETGVPNFKTRPIVLSKGNSESIESSIYNVDLSLNEADSELSLYFKLEEGDGDEIYSITLNEHQFDAVSSQEIIFTGSTDTVTISIPITTEFITFQTIDFPIGQLKIGKTPLFYLLNQLRSEKPTDRITAAKLLVNHAENPDLQLALADILAFEENEEVIAAIFTALSALTNGATGTEEQFISGLSNSWQAIQLASIQALTNYPDNDYAKSSLRSKVMRSEGEVFELALRSYNKVAIGDEMLSLINSIVRRDTVGLKTLKTLQVADSLYQNEEAIEITNSFISDDFPYSIREKALEHLNSYDIDADRWNQRLNNLISDRDPRIRFWAVEHAPRFKSAPESLIFLKSAEINEFDPRVLLMIQGVKEELAE